MIILQAPYPLIEVTSQLPDPEFKDSIGSINKVNRKRALNGTIYTYIKTSPKLKLDWDFDISALKASELKAFYLTYTTNLIKITDWESNKYIGYFIQEAIVFKPKSFGEWTDVHLTFEVELLS